MYLFKFVFVWLVLISGLNNSKNTKSTFQGQATYISKSKLELGRWGARMSEAQKNQVAARLKNRLEKMIYVSSIAALGEPNHNGIIDENSFWNFTDRQGF